VAPAARRPARVLDSGRGRLVADLDAVLSTVRPVLVADPPVDGVGAWIEEAYTGLARVLERRPHGPGVVLVVRAEHVGLVGRGPRPVELHVRIGLVGDVVPRAFQPRDGREVRPRVPVENVRDRRGSRLLKGTVEGD